MGVAGWGGGVVGGRRCVWYIQISTDYMHPTLLALRGGRRVSHFYKRKDLYVTVLALELPHDVLPNRQCFGIE